MSDTHIESAVVRWSEQPGKELSRACTIWSAPGEQLHLVKMRLAAGTVFPEHAHPHEQITYVLEGEMLFTVGGRDVSVGAGDCVRVPPSVPHSASVTSAIDAVTIEAFTPVRDDLA